VINIQTERDERLSEKSGRIVYSTRATLKSAVKLEEMLKKAAHFKQGISLP